MRQCFFLYRQSNIGLTSRWFYGGDDFLCLQLVFPDTSGHFPWSSGSSEGFRTAQPDLTAGNWSGLRNR
ncbi:MAG TPA: DUF4262 domain-containing protein [Xanthobacteraceae bacterium]